MIKHRYFWSWKTENSVLCIGVLILLLSTITYHITMNILFYLSWVECTVLLILFVLFYVRVLNLLSERKRERKKRIWILQFQGVVSAKLDYLIIAFIIY